jgi:hypothetical protein
MHELIWIFILPAVAGAVVGSLLSLRSTPPLPQRREPRLGKPSGVSVERTDGRKEPRLC